MVLKDSLCDESRLLKKGSEILLMQCDQFRQLADSYLNNELIVETNHQINSHLEHCPECHYELAARRELRTKLQQAFRNAPQNQMRPEFAAQLNKQLRDKALGKRPDSVTSAHVSQSLGRQRRTSLLAVAASLVLAIGMGLVLFRYISKPSPPVGPVSLVGTELARSAVGDHRDCAIHFRLSEKPIDLEVAGHKYDPVYIDLTKVVLSQGNVELVEDHSCVYESRRFAHIVLKYHGRLVSFLVTAATTEGTAQSRLESEVIACSQFEGYQVSCFQTERHAVFIVSDMPEGDNLALARALAPSVFAHITRLERTT